MTKPKFRSYSRYARDTVQLLGLMIRNTRIERNITIREVAERAGISRGLVQRIESGNMGTSIGVAFEVAAIVGLELFESESSNLKRHLSLERDKLVLLKSVRKKTRKINDNF
ncbi:MAG: helix-turn-helix transcriptional regulator [Rhodobacteraceae bacterium]|nr:helix-turn-helix transcriptional regulator [Paracoccaceae bacterium]MXZ50057.1 helix-turn-helix transcriptional regulator [Paracoccaceae bacterium]MYF46684.1 helix-turn-helix transcriptional regulator [Paracoccaceae bacterium]MYI91278.1 helix-turn-helix transcriptional regulator [Paracoccaceae bacterium]